MKLSELTNQEIAALRDEQKTKIIFGNLEDDGGKGEFVVLLGGRLPYLAERVDAAAGLYHAGRVSLVVPSGGVKWEHEDGEITEAEYMKGLLLERGVPEEAIVMENEATTTKENMIYATLQMNRKLGLPAMRRAYVATSQSHMRRALRYAEIFFPSTVEVAPCAAIGGVDAKDCWYKTEAGRERAERELYLIKKQVDLGILEDIDLD